MTATRRVPTLADVAQVAGSRLALAHGLTSVRPGSAVCGPAVTCVCARDDNLALHRALRSAPAGSVVVCQTDLASRCGHVGELMSLDALGAGVAAIVLDGPLRDRAGIAALGLPVFHRGVGPRSCTKTRAVSVGAPVIVAGVPVAPGDQVIADDDGVGIVQAEHWDAILRGVAALQVAEDKLAEAVRGGERLGDLLDLSGEAALDGPPSGGDAESAAESGSAGEPGSGRPDS